MDKLEYNKTIIKILKDSNIPKDEGLTILTCLYFKLEPKVLFEDGYYQNILMLLGPLYIFNRDTKTNEVKWLVPLFGDDDKGLEWVTEWMNLFKEVNPERRGSKKDVIDRFDRFFKQYPLFTKNEIFNATKYYLNGLRDPQYCKKSHKFIYDIEGSMLLDHLEVLQKSQEANNLFL